MCFPVGNGGCSLPFKDYRRTLLMDKILHQFIQCIRSIYHVSHSLSCLKHLNWCRMLSISFRKSLTRKWDNPLKLVNYMILSNSSWPRCWLHPSSIILCWLSIRRSSQSDLPWVSFGYSWSYTYLIKCPIMNRNRYFAQLGLLKAHLLAPVGWWLKHYHRAVA